MKHKPKTSGIKLPAPLDLETLQRALGMLLRRQIDKNLNMPKFSICKKQFSTGIKLSGFVVSNIGVKTWNQAEPSGDVNQADKNKQRDDSQKNHKNSSLQKRAMPDSNPKPLISKTAVLPLSQMHRTVDWI